MKKIFLLSFLFPLMVLTVYSQKIMDLQYTAAQRNYGMRRVIDTCNLSVTYHYEYVIDTAKISKYYEPMVLEVGNVINRYYSQNADIRDSLIYNEYKKKIKQKGHADGVKGVNWFSENQSTTYIDIYTSPKDDSRSIYTRIGVIDYLYKEPISNLDWRMLPETDTVLGYLCNKAETEFRGRKWYAWFSMDIPYNFGPWKLGGLPGLILKAEDSDGLFSWIATEIEQPKKRSIYNYAEGRESVCGHLYTIKKCKRKDVAKLWQRRWVNPMSIYLLNGAKRKIYLHNADRTLTDIKITMDLPDKYYPRLELDM